MFDKEKILLEVAVPAKTLLVEHAACPNGHSLIDAAVTIHGKPAIKVKVRHEDKAGWLYIDPIYGSYDNIEKDISLPRGGVVEFYCPQCGASLADTTERCQLCSSPMFVFHLPKGSIVEGCLRKGCIFHKLKIIDAEQQLSRLFQNDTLEAFL